VFALVVFLIAVGCSAEIQVKKAERAIKSAHSVHADYLATYEFASAEYYLEEAINQLHESDFHSATTFATRAVAQANVAEQKARLAHAKPMVPWSPDAVPAAPPPPPPPAAVKPVTPPPPPPKPAAVVPAPKPTPPVAKPTAPTAKPATPPPAKPASPPPTKPTTPPPTTQPPATTPPATPPPVTPPPPKKKPKKVTEEYPLGEPEDEDEDDKGQGGGK
jgi:hypothetical protein